MGVPAKRTTHPDRDFDVIGSIWASFVSLITRVVGVYPTIKLPWSFGMDDEVFVASAQEVPANPLDRFGVALFRVFGEPSALVHADGDVRSR